jgi:cell division transport system permease protein
MRHPGHYFTLHFQAMINSLGQLSKTPLASIMTCLVIGIALAFPAALFVALKNFETVGNTLQQTLQITLYLKSGIKESSVDTLAKDLQGNPNIAAIKTISPDEGLTELQQQAGFQGAMTELPHNPLPWTLIVLPKSVDQLDPLTQRLGQLPQVELLQVDKIWAKRLLMLTSLIQRFIYALAVFLGIAVFLIINSTIHFATQQNQKEIEIIKLIGGTPAFIRRPFLYAGMLYGLLGGIIAWQLVDMLLLSLNTPIRHLASLYHSQFHLAGIGIHNTLILLINSLLLGLLAAWLAVTRHLKSC